MAIKNVLIPDNLGNEFDLGVIEANKVHLKFDGVSLFRDTTTGALRSIGLFLTPATNGGSANIPVGCAGFRVANGNWVNNLVLPASAPYVGFVLVVTSAAGFDTTVMATNTGLHSAQVLRTGQRLIFVWTGVQWDLVPNGRRSIRIVTATGALTADDDVVFIRNAALAVTLTLPHAGTCAGKVISLRRDSNADTGTIVINGGGTTIEVVTTTGLFGAVSALGTTALSRAATWMSDGIRWVILA